MDIKASFQKLDSAIEKLNSEFNVIDENAKLQYNDLKKFSEQFFEYVKSKIKPELHKLMSLKINYGNLRPNKSIAYITFYVNRPIILELDFNNNDFYSKLAYYIDMINHY